jgi:hypothetical protein
MADPVAKPLEMEQVGEGGGDGTGEVSEGRGRGGGRWEVGGRRGGAIATGRGDGRTEEDETRDEDKDAVRVRWFTRLCLRGARRGLSGVEGAGGGDQMAAQSLGATSPTVAHTSHVLFFFLFSFFNNFSSA